MIAVIIFTKNEEKIIGKVIDNLRFVLKQIPNVKFTIFVCDDSKDKTNEIVLLKGCKIIKGSGMGLGWSYYLALYHVVHQYKLHSLITLDGDGQTDLSEISYFYEEFKKGYDLVVGSRFLKKNAISYSYRRINFIGVKILSLMISFSCFRKFTDSHGGLRIMAPVVAKNVRFLAGHSYVQETIIDAVKRGFRVKELPTKWNKRNYGISRVVHSPVYYIRKMLLGLLLRMNMHLYIGLFSVSLIFLPIIGVGSYFLGFSFRLILYLLLGMVVGFALYKHWVFKKTINYLFLWQKESR